MKISNAQMRVLRSINKLGPCRPYKIGLDIYESKPNVWMVGKMLGRLEDAGLVMWVELHRQTGYVLTAAGRALV